MPVAQSVRLADLGSNPVTYLSTVPADPSREATPTAVAYVLDGDAYDELDPNQLEVGDLADPPASPPAGVLPSAPFFLN